MNMVSCSRVIRHTRTCTTWQVLDSLIPTLSIPDVHRCESKSGMESPRYNARCLTCTLLAWPIHFFWHIFVWCCLGLPYLIVCIVKVGEWYPPPEQLQHTSVRSAQLWREGPGLALPDTPPSGSIDQELLHKWTNVSSVLVHHLSLLVTQLDVRTYIMHSYNEERIALLSGSCTWPHPNM